MANSFSFNSVDLAGYGMTITTSDLVNLSRGISTIQLPDKAYAGSATRPLKTLSIEVVVQGTSVADLYSKLDSIKQKLDIETDCQLIFDSLTTRYFNARLQDISGSKVSEKTWVGTITFLCADPLGYAVTPTTDHHHIDADPHTHTITTLGTGMIKPVYTLTAGDVLAGATIKIKNTTTSEEIIWIGTLAITDTLEIDVEHWIIKKNGTASMADVSGTFPRLSPATNNTIVVTGFLTGGTLDTVYRNVYL